VNFSFDETQSALAGLARQVFTEHATHDRLKALEAGGQSFDADLWDALGRAGLLGVGIEEGGFLEQCIVLVEQGRTVAPVPLWSHLLGGAVVGRADGVLTVALDEPGAEDAFAVGTRAERSGEGWVLHGEKVGVLAFEEATGVVVSAHTGDPSSVFLVEPGALEAERRETTARFPECFVRFDNTEAELVSEDAGELARRAIVALCALGVGVAERALELTASYASERKQFERPLGSFQAVQQRAADAYVDVLAMRTTMWQAAWRLSEGLEADREIGIAKFWAAEGGQRVVSSAQHLHGGLGADIDYPLHRYTLWAKWIELAFGGATAQLARLGAELATASVGGAP
jgi:alkylation response protein AidB-like acyl-CoA dehydrogenase